jgi:hypothetical protein
MNLFKWYVGWQTIAATVTIIMAFCSHAHGVNFMGSSVWENIPPMGTFDYQNSQAAVSSSGGMPRWLMWVSYF